MRKYGECKTTRIMMATEPHVTSVSGLRKFQADGFFLDRVYIIFICGRGLDTRCFPEEAAGVRLHKKHEEGIHRAHLGCNVSSQTSCTFRFIRKYNSSSATTIVLIVKVIRLVLLQKRNVYKTYYFSL